MYKVFLVDDEPFIIEGLYDIVEWSDLGLEIVGSAGNGKQALEALKHTPADLLITDISMPFMDGLQLIREARAIKRDLKVIILSGYNEFEYLKEGLALGIENYLLKPINVDEMESTLKNAVEKLDLRSESLAPLARDRDILKENILYRWMTGAISEAELTERAALLNFDISRAAFLVALIRTNREGNSLVEAISELRAPEGLDMVHFRDLQGDVVALFLMQEAEEGKRKALDQLRWLRRRVERAGAEECRIAVGAVARDIREVPHSFADARKAQEYFLLFDRSEIIDYSALPLGKEPKMSDIVSALDYEKLILAKDEEKLLRSIEKDFEACQRVQGMTPALLQSIAIEMIIQFHLPFRSGQHAEFQPWYGEGIRKAAAAATKEQLVGIVKEAAKGVMEALRTDGRSPIVKQVLTHIHNSYHESLTLKGMGERYHIHPAYLGQLFQRETETTFTEYINRYRIEQAKRMLQETNEKVQDIAKSVGYWEIGYFYKQFKKYVGVSPREVRELL